MIWHECKIVEAPDDATIRPPRTSQGKREPGLHLSRIIHDLADTVQKPQRKAETQDARGFYMEVGEAFEDALEATLNERIWPKGEPGHRPKARKLDGIWCSPDRVTLAPNGHMIEEHKATWKTCRNGLEHDKFWRWWMQAAGYCWVWETTACRFRVLWMCGDYRPPIPKRIKYDNHVHAGVTEAELGNADQSCEAEGDGCNVRFCHVGFGV